MVSKLFKKLFHVVLAFIFKHERGKDIEMKNVIEESGLDWWKWVDIRVLIRVIIKKTWS